MIDREKVIKGLECCIITPDICSDVCPYFGKCDENDYCDEKLFKDALALLKAQAPRRGPRLRQNGLGELV